eukprot:34104-Pyramimonas_sp.AAC.1
MYMISWPEPEGEETELLITRGLLKAPVDWPAPFTVAGHRWEVAPPDGVLGPRVCIDGPGLGPELPQFSRAGWAV